MQPMQRTLEGPHLTPVMIAQQAFRGTLHQTCQRQAATALHDGLRCSRSAADFEAAWDLTPVQARPGASIRGDALTGQKLGECLFGSGPVHHFRSVAVLRGPARGKVFPLLLKQ